MLFVARIKSRLEKHESEAGFTLLEILIVLVLIGLLATIAAPPLIRQFSKAKMDIAQAQMDSLGATLDLYRIDLGRYPTTEEGLLALLDRPDDVIGWLGPYVRKESSIVDPWGRAFIYEAAEDEVGFRLQTFGADGAPGGEGESRDVVSTN